MATVYNKKKGKSRGFTIIELIVVIAIIAILAAIILINVIQYIDKGKDAAIKEEMNELSVIASNIYGDNGSYDHMLDSPDVENIEKSSAANSPETDSPPIQILAQGQQYCASAQLWDGSTWCVDNTGYAGPVQDDYVSCSDPSDTCNAPTQ